MAQGTDGPHLEAPSDDKLNWRSQNPFEEDVEGESADFCLDPAADDWDPWKQHGHYGYWDGEDQAQAKEAAPAGGLALHWTLFLGFRLELAGIPQYLYLPYQVPRPDQVRIEFDLRENQIQVDRF